LDTIADDSKNDMARAAAVKALEVIADQADERTPRGAVVPGLQIVIVNGTAAPKVIGPAPFPPAPSTPPIIEHQPAAE
jgi:hypothetical protein